MTTRADPLVALPRTAATHFRLHLYGAVLALRDHLGLDAGSVPGLAGYLEELERAGATDAAGWDARLARWERDAPPGLPLIRVDRMAGLGPEGLRALMLAGLAEEDARFGALYSAVQGPGLVRPGAGLVAAATGADDIRPALARARAAGLVAPDPNGLVAVDPHVWEALRGVRAGRPAPWLRWTPARGAPAIADLVLDPGEAARATRLAGLLDRVPAVIVRGPRAAGRRTLLAAVAARAGRGVLHADPDALDAARWPVTAVIAAVYDALLVTVLDPGPGEVIDVPDPPGEVPLAVVLGTEGAVRGPRVDRAVVVDSGVPGPGGRRAHWRAALPEVPDAGAATRMTGGNIRRVGAAARAAAALRGEPPGPRHVAAAVRDLQARRLGELARPLPDTAGWDRLALAAEVMEDLRLLEARCRAREALADAGGPALRGQIGPGVRALFSGASGTGKTLAARVLAGSVGLGLHRVDVPGLVSKYVGETERNLSTLFARAEETDAALLLDEGDALMTRRTAVQSANDRYANLETNYLLQRLETFAGVLIVTTNAADRIDAAFRRRFDMVIAFPAPGPAERLAIWRMHLAGGADQALLVEIARRCALTGGQIRNAALHAALLGVAGREPDPRRAILAAVRREYRSAGAVCPLPVAWDG